MTYLHLCQLLSAHEADEAYALKWWQASSDAEKMLVWDAIQKLGATPLSEVVSRMAQLGFTHLALLAEKGKADA